MIKGQSRTEANYRSLQTDSSSSLKEFSIDRKKYYRRYVLLENLEDKDNQAIKIGKLVETLLFERDEFDKRFYMSASANAPTGLMLEFVEALYSVTKEATDGFGIVNRTFEELSREAYVMSGFKIKYEQVIGKFIGSDAEIYYNEIRKVRSQGLIVVDSNDVNTAERIVEELRNNPVTRGIVNLESDVRYTVLKQFQIEEYYVCGHAFKSMIDLVIVDHEEKTITPYDLKCTWSVENFYEEYYLYRRAYIQAYLYWRAISELAESNNSKWHGYKVEHTRFIVCDSTNYYNPLVYTLGSMDMDDAYFGFEHKGRKYPGVEEIIKDLQWALAEGVWNISRRNHENGGVINIRG